MSSPLMPRHGRTRPPYDDLQPDAPVGPFDEQSGPAMTTQPYREAGALGDVGSQPPNDREPTIPQTDGDRTREGGWMGDRDLLSIIQREIDSSLGWTGTRLAEARRKNLAQYFSNPRGDEREGRSQVVTRDVFEQVEWLLPSLMEIFTSGPEVAKFQAEGPEDEDGADQATAAVNYVFRQGDGFMVLYTMFKDALIQKNGVVKVWWEDIDEACHETYDGKTMLEVQQLQADPNFEFRESTAWIQGEGEGGQKQELSEEELEQIDPQMAMQSVFFDIAGVRINKTGRVQMENIPPEEFYVNRDCRGLADTSCRFLGQRIRTSESHLIAMGFDPDLVRRLPGSQSVYTTDQDAIIRASQDDSFPLVYSYRHDSERSIYVSESYVKVDRDGDGISEWWKVTTGGDYAQELLEATPVGGHPFVSCTPIPIPHRFYGLGLADVTGDLQEINSTLWRQYLNSLYLKTDPRTIVLSRGEGETAMPMVNLDQLLNAAPGSYIEEYTPNALRPFEQNHNAAEILPAFDIHEKMKLNRTGISPDAMGVNPDQISKHVYGTMVQTSAAAQRTTLYARIFADTGVRNLFRKIYKELLQHQLKPMMVRLRGDWVEVNPSDWKTGMDCIISVGLGHGSKMEKAANLQTIGQVQKEFIEGGLTQMAPPEKLHNTASDLVEALGFRDGSKYFVDPSTVPPPEPQPDPAEEAVKAQIQVEFMKLELQRQKQDLERDKFSLEIKKTELEHEIKIQELRKEGYPAEPDMGWQLPQPGQAEKPPPAPMPQPRPDAGPA